MMGLIKEYFASKVQEIKNQSDIRRVEVQLIEQLGNIVTEKPDDDGFLRIGGDSEAKGFDSSNQREMIKAAREYFRKDPNAKAVVQTMTNYVIGRGVQITSKSKDPVVNLVWREFWTAKRNKMELKQFEMVIRTFRDGDLYVRIFNKTDEGKPVSKSTLRYIDPLNVVNPPNNTDGFDVSRTKDGIESLANDRESVTAYWVKVGNGATDFEKVNAEEMVHIKLQADSDQERSDSVFLPVMKLFRNYEQWLNSRILLNKLRTAIVIIKKVDGGGADVNRIANTLSQASNQRTGESKKESIKGGTVITANQGVSYEMLSANINAGDVAEDGRNIKLSIAAGTNTPEYIYGDASNANFASSLIAESPFVKSIEYWQQVFEYWWGEIYAIVIKNAAKAGMLKEPSDEEFIRKVKGVGELKEQADPKQEEKMKQIMPNGKIQLPSEIFFGMDATWPEIIHRNPKEYTESLVLARGAGWMSDKEASERLGYEYEEQVRKQKKIEENAELEGNPLLGVKPGEGEEDDQVNSEIQSLMKSMTPEEKDRVAKSEDPSEVVQMLLNKMSQNGKTPAGAKK